MLVLADFLDATGSKCYNYMLINNDLLLFRTSMNNK